MEQCCNCYNPMAWPARFAIRKPMSNMKGYCWSNDYENTVRLKWVNHSGDDLISSHLALWLNVLDQALSGHVLIRQCSMLTSACTFAELYQSLAPIRICPPSNLDPPIHHDFLGLIIRLIRFLCNLTKMNLACVFSLFFQDEADKPYSDRPYFNLLQLNILLRNVSIFDSWLTALNDTLLSILILTNLTIKGVQNVIHLELLDSAKGMLTLRDDSFEDNDSLLETCQIEDLWADKPMLVPFHYAPVIIYVWSQTDWNLKQGNLMSQIPSENFF